VTVRKWLLRGTLFFGGLVIVYMLYVCYLVWHYARTDEARPVDAIVVLGSAQYNGVPSADLKARLDHALELWNDHYASTIVVTGGKEQGDVHTEASTSAAYLSARGVPDSAILREVQGRNSWQSLQAASRFMKERNIHRVLLVSDSFHNARIYQMSKDLGLKPYVSATTTSPITGAARIPYLIKEVGELAVGKIIGFERIGGLERNL
jgi:uncharacterized SAM-binding protein YcdF (DUF218 family)